MTQGDDELRGDNATKLNDYAYCPEDFRAASYLRRGDNDLSEDDGSEPDFETTTIYSDEYKA